MSTRSSGYYSIDADYQITGFNDTARDLYPGLQLGQKCHKALMGLDSPCPVCPVANGICGPRTYLDPIRKIYETVDAVETVRPDGSRGHALVFSTVDEGERLSGTLPTGESSLRLLGAINLLSLDYSVVFGVNMHTRRITVYRSENPFGQTERALRDHMTYSDALEAFVGRLVYPDDRDALRETLRLETVKARLDREASFRVHFRAMKERLHYFYLQIVRNGEADSYQDFVVAIACEDNDVNARRIYERQLETFLQAGACAAVCAHLDITFNRILSIRGACAGSLDGDDSVDGLVRRLAQRLPHEQERRGLQDGCSQAAMMQAYDAGRVKIVLEARGSSEQQAPRWLRFDTRLLMNPGSGHLEGVLCVEDVTRDREAVKIQEGIVQALCSNYLDAFLLDIEEKTATMIKHEGNPSTGLTKDARVFRYDQMVDIYVSRIVHPDDREMMRSALQLEHVLEALGSGKEYAQNYRVISRGEIHHYQTRFIKNEAYGIIVMGSVNVDDVVATEVEHQKELTNALTALQRESAVSIALSREYSSLFRIDGETGRISLYRTEEGRGIDAQTLDQLLETGDYAAVMHRYIETMVVREDRARLRELSRLENLQRMVPDVGLYKLGFRREMDGVVAYCEMNVVRIAHGSDHPAYILGIRDVDEEMRRQLQLTREMEMQREIIEGLGSEYYSVLLVNPDADSVTPFRTAEEDGRDIADYFFKYGNRWSKGLRSYAQELVSEKTRDEFLEKLSLPYIRAHRQDYSLTYEKLTRGDIVYLQARVAYVREPDGRYAAVIGTRNVDDLIKKERQQEMAMQAAFDAAEAASRAKTNFLSNMSHDIRTPMNGIIGMTAIAAAHIDDRERVKDSLQKITQASKHLLSLINEVLDMSKIEAGKVQLEEEEFNLSDLVDNLLTMTSDQAREHQHELHVSISDLTHEAVIGDSLRIQKVFVNLMSNAVKYTPDGGVIRLSISEKPSGQPKIGCYEFVFEDNGIGMQQEFVERIFEPFVRADDHRVSQVQGTGLGMPISRSIVRMMGGDIKVESAPGVGSRFTVTMYLRLQDGQGDSCERFVDLPVLVADDDALSLESCCGMLCDLGMKPTGVASGREAVCEVLRRHEQQRDFFACILDWRMPDLDGIAATRAIRRAVGRDVPIIIISAYDWSEIEQEARAAGADAFISKPMFRSRLAKTFNQLLGDEALPEPLLPMDELTRMELSGRRALLVEDNELNAEIATEILGMTGLSVERAHDGMEAVDRMSACGDGYYDIVFMDIQMPRMNGYDATRAIRAMERSYCRQVPIVALTANAFAEDVQAAKTAGMNGHMAKPLDLKVLSGVLARWLGQ